MYTKDLIFNAAKHKLTATKVSPSLVGSLPYILTLHGLGTTATRHSIRYILDYLAQHNHTSICFEFSGNGESTGILAEASLGLRQSEALTAAKLLDTTQAPVLIGTSMGAHLAASLVPMLNPRALILFCPAAYPAYATNLKFGLDFTKPGNYDDSPAYKGIESFNGNLLIVAARNDQVVSANIIDGYLEHAQQAKYKEVIWLNDCDHFIHRWLPYQGELTTRVQQAILHNIGV